MLRILDHAPGRVRDCIAAQLGRIAARNSCRESGTPGLDLRANVRPALPHLQRRGTVSVDVRNVLTGLDAALHGRANAQSRRQCQRADNILLNVRGFDRPGGAFIYEVNEAFGQARRGQTAARNAFTIGISARTALGGPPAAATRGFGQATSTERQRLVVPVPAFTAVRGFVLLFLTPVLDRIRRQPGLFPRHARLTLPLLGIS
jgi:hypothetical protein